MEEKKGKQALYRRYRSASFDELIGQEHVTELLKAAINSNSFSHAYLFTGQRGTGKTSAARILAYAINNLPYEAGANNLDIIEIDAASNRRIDDIRDLREKVHIAPVAAKYKVYIIDEVHMLTAESFNALLKTLEEPPEHAIFILATTELHKVPATIVSRTQRFHFRPVALSKVVDHLRSIAEKEQIDISDEALSIIAEHGGGSFRDSISLLDQVAGLGGTITDETVELILGRARSADVKAVLTTLVDADQEGLHNLLNTILSQGTSPVTLSEQLTTALLQEARPDTSWYELTEKLMSVPRAHFPQLLLISTLLGFVAQKPTTVSQPAKIEAPTPAQPAPVEQPVEKSPPQAVNKRVTLGGATPTSGGHSMDAEVGVDRASGPASQRSYVASAESTNVRRERAESEDGGSENTNPVVKQNKNAAFDWDKVLATSKKANPALFAVLSRATIHFADNTLTLTFQYALHRKKLDQAQYRTQVSRLIQDACGVNPTIVIDGNGPQLASDTTTKQVADLMGGGERVTV